jgi:hypothetical protein
MPALLLVIRSAGPAVSTPQADFSWPRPGYRGVMIKGPEFGMRFLDDHDKLTRQQIKPGTVRRVLPYARRYRAALAVLAFITVLDSGITVANPLILGFIIDDGGTHRELLAAGGRYSVLHRTQFSPS